MENECKSIPILNVKFSHENMYIRIPRKIHPKKVHFTELLNYFYLLKIECVFIYSSDELKRYLMNFLIVGY